MDLASPSATAIEHTVRLALDWLRLGIEVIGALIVAAGIVAAIVAFTRRISNRSNHKHLRSTRNVLAHYLAIALEFQLAADILSTALAPTWTQIGKLAAIAAIRTALNYFLTLEMRNDSSGKRFRGRRPGRQDSATPGKEKTMRSYRLLANSRRNSP